MEFLRYRSTTTVTTHSAMKATLMREKENGACGNDYSYTYCAVASGERWASMCGSYLNALFTRARCDIPEGRLNKTQQKKLP